MHEQKTFVVDTADNHQRIDKYIAQKAEISRSYLAVLIEKQLCTVNGKPVAKNHKIKSGDTIALYFPENEPLCIQAEDIPLAVVYEDDSLIVVHKPRGMVVHPAHGHTGGTLVNALLFHCKDSLSGINGVSRPGIVHRIDKDTSGLLVAAKHDLAHEHLAAQLKAHTIKREYEAIACGAVKQNGIVDAPIGRHKIERKKMCVVNPNDTNAKHAVTHYTVLQRFPGYTHLRLRLETGRTHQIRVHMAYIGHPLAGDAVYGSGRPKWLMGQCLHAKTLGFVHPVTGQYMEFTTALPPYFLRMLKEADKA